MNIIGIARSKKKRFTRKRIIAVVSGVIVVLLLIAVGIWVWRYRPLRQSNGSQPNTDSLKIQKERARQVSEDLHIANNETDYAKGVLALQKKLADSTSNQRKAEVYLQLVSLALNNKHPDDALAYAQSADATYPTYLSAYALGDAMAAKGDKTAALKYYKLAIERVGDPGDDDVKHHMISNVDSRIRRLSQ